MSSEPVTNTTPLTSCLVIGGLGFLGSHIIRALLAKHPNCIITAADIRLAPTDQISSPNLTYVTVDITDLSNITSVIRNCKPEIIFHTASPIHGLGKAVYMKVNVEGTKNVLQACEDVGGVKVFVYTSSAGVVFDGNPLVNVDETEPFPQVPFDAYNDSKAIAESIALKANNSSTKMLTTALRPAGIFGPGDRQVIPGFINVVKNNQTHWQLGDNTNLFDFTYITNLAQAHLLAASVLLHQYNTTGASDPSTDQRNRVDGTALFVTNGEPVYFWDFARAIWANYGVCRTWHIVLPRNVGIAIGFLAENFSKLVGKEPGFTVFRVKFSCYPRYYDIRKAKDLLGYKPEVSLAEGMRRTIAWCREEDAKAAAAAAAKK